MTRYIATYDVSDDLQRGRIANVLQDYGYRIQYSVFEMNLQESELIEVQRRLGMLLSKEDRLELIPIDMDHRRKRLRWMGSELDQPVIVVK